MEFTFANSALLWLGLGAAVPVIIHILNRQRYQRIQWAAMQFIYAALQKTRKKLQIENLILLIVRTLIILFLVGAIARPFFSSLPAALVSTADTHLVIAFDTSFSMEHRSAGGESSFENAKKVAKGLISGLRVDQGDQLTFIVFNESSSLIKGDGTIQVKYIQDYIDSLDVSNRATSIMPALKEVKDVVAKSKNSRKRTFIITDLQRAAWPESGSAEYSAAAALLSELGSQCELSVVDMGSDDISNLCITGLTPKKNLISTGEEVVFEVVVSNFGPVPVTAVPVHFFVDGIRQITTLVPEIKRFGSNTLSFLATFRDPGPHHAHVQIDSPDIEKDNTRFVAVDVLDMIPILCVDGDPSPGGYRTESELFYFQPVIQPTIDDVAKNSVFSPESVSSLSFSSADLSSYELIVLANVDTVSPEKIGAMEEFVKEGKSLMIFLGEKVDKVIYNDLLYKDGKGLLPAELLEYGNSSESQGVFFRTSEMDFTHPIFSVFGQRESYLKRFFYYQFVKTKVEVDRTDVKVLVRYDDPDRSAAVIEKQFGLGRVILFTSTADDDWNILPRLDAGEYWVIVNNAVSYLCSRTSNKTLVVGDEMRSVVGVQDYSRSFVITAPMAAPVAIKPVEVKGVGFVILYKNSEQTGVYVLEKSVPGASPSMESYFAVNVRNSESDLGRISHEELTKSFVGMDVVSYKDAGSDKPAALTAKPSSGSGWRYLLYAALAFVVLESILAMVFTGRQQ